MTLFSCKFLFQATISSLDTSAVKEKCRLSFNFSREGLHGGANAQHKSETLYIRSQRDNQKKLETTEISLSSELYVAPEMMYASLDLPGMVNEATKDLPDYLLKDCFSNILITGRNNSINLVENDPDFVFFSGGNTDLNGFVQRFSSDLRELLPEHSPIINVCPYPTGNHSWNTVMGANAVPIPMPYGKIPRIKKL